MKTVLKTNVFAAEIIPADTASICRKVRFCERSHGRQKELTISRLASTTGRPAGRER